MSEHKYRICRNEKFWFELLPNNHNSQPVVQSSLYDTYDETIKGINKFKMYMLKHTDDELDFENIFMKANSYQYRIYFDLSHNEHISARICERFNLRKTRKRIRDNYAVSIRYDL